jgi:hypothetical protein
MGGGSGDAGPADGGDGDGGRERTYAASPTTLVFHSCPTRSPQGSAVADLTPDVQLVVVTNTSSSDAGLVATFSGDDAGAFSFWMPPPGGIAARGQTSLQLAFAPPTLGSFASTLALNAPGEAPVSVSLIGDARTLPLVPTLETLPQIAGTPSFRTCTASSPLADCTLSFPDTLLNQSTTLQLKLRNTGCPTLKVTGLEIESLTGPPHEFTIDTPSRLPSVASPMPLSVADGTDETALTVRFTPQNDGSGNPSRTARLALHSNDPVAGAALGLPSLILLEANVLVPSISASPTLCEFSNQADRCGFTVKTANRARFVVTNTGNSSVQVSNLSFRSTGGTTGSGGRFVVSQNVQGQTLPPAASATLEVTHADQPLYLTDQLDLEASVVGQPSASAGRVTLVVRGGVKPCLSTEPPDQLTFTNPASPTTQTLRIRNGAGCGVLRLDALTIEPNRFFSLVGPALSPGLQIPAGGEFTATVQYERPLTGGLQLGTLHVETNDSDFAPPQHKLVQLYAATPLDQVPVAVLTACTPASLVNDPHCARGVESGFSAQLSMLAVPEITLSGFNSTDDRAIRDYRFTLVAPLPGNVTASALANSGVTTTAPTAKLTIPSGAAGIYRVQLEVWDDRGQRSSKLMSLSIYP